MKRKTAQGKSDTAKSFNAQHKVISPEYIIPNQKYAFTINPLVQPEHNWYNEKIDSFARFEKSVTDLIGFCKFCKVDVRCEISGKGRLHYHGYIVITDVVNFYYYDIPYFMKNSSFEIDTINDIEKWNTYITKMGPSMKKWCETKGLTYQINTMRGNYSIASKIEEIEYKSQCWDDFEIEEDK